MAHLSNCITFLLFTTLLLALQISARDSQFFSKVSHFDNNNVKETEVPNKEAAEVSKVDQQPPFVRETENSYGLYGHDESNQVPSSTTTKSTTPTSYHPYKTEFENTQYFNNDAYNNRFAETNNNKNSYEGDQYDLSDTKYTEQGYNNNNYQNNNQMYYNNDGATYKFYDNNNNQKYYNDNDPASYKSYDNNKYYKKGTVSHEYYNNKNYNGNANTYNGEKQGMSDTRFLEGGRYYHDIHAEENYPTNYEDSSRGVNNNNWYNNRGGNYNGYQNQKEFEDEHENFEP